MNVNNQIKVSGVVCPAMCVTGYIARLVDGSLNASVVPQSRIQSCVRCNASMACGGTCPNGTYETGGGMCAPCTTKCPLGFYPAGCRGTTDAVCISCGSLQNPSATSSQSSNRTSIQDTALTNAMRWLPWRDSYAGLSAAALLRTTGATCDPTTRCCRACRNNYAWVNASVPVCLPCPASRPYSVWNASGVNSSGVLGACTTCPAGHDVIDSSDVLCEGMQGSGPASQNVGVVFVVGAVLATSPIRGQWRILTHERQAGDLKSAQVSSLQETRDTIYYGVGYTSFCCGRLLGAWESKVYVALSMRSAWTRADTASQLLGLAQRRARREPSRLR